MVGSLEGGELVRWGWSSRRLPLLRALGRSCPAFPALGSKQYSAAIAFTLALFSHLVNHVNIRLQAELEEGENPGPAFQSDGTGALGGVPECGQGGGRYRATAQVHCGGRGRVRGQVRLVCGDGKGSTWGAREVVNRCSLPPGPT